MKIRQISILKISVLTILLTCFCSINLIAQNKETDKVEKKEYLKGLTKASEKDLSDKQIMFDGESIPVYNIKGKRIRGNEMMEAMMSGNYTPDFYIDSNKEIKVAVLRIATEDEKKMMKEMQAQINSQSDLIGTDASVFSATDINGNEFSLNSLKGKIIVMNFWFIECKPCVMEMPELNELVKKYKNKDIVFLGFATNSKSRIDSFLKKKDFYYTIIPNSEKIAIDYKVSGYPTHIIIDKNSKIVYSTTGLGSTTINDIEKTIESLIQK
ncbi:TlpA family protein disulfide reductase [Polaribacter cellanae]|uniref:TlpA family protein disulfide reductase n=1 Tax=Polaribacter cellanae TaxID=2818493 RepID=A0A975CMW8_9FLAO|nr:TlpA disulfide reductase family protein [Polaribacter cellanae]QTE22264.1 TlpA family protein disulfide reductase [Polaribacter cellanae]